MRTHPTLGRGRRRPADTAAAQQRFTRRLSECGNIRDAAAAAGVGRRSVYRWFAADVRFRRAVMFAFDWWCLMLQDDAMDMVPGNASDDALLYKLAVLNSAKYGFDLLERRRVRRKRLRVTWADLIPPSAAEVEGAQLTTDDARRLLTRWRKRASVLRALL
jgi:AcrR family transcriptional regulator